MAITHAKVSAKSDGGDSSLVLPSDWNDDHVADLLAIANIAQTTLGSSNTEVDLGSAFDCVGGTLIAATITLVTGGPSEAAPFLWVVGGGAAFASGTYKTSVPEGWVWHFVGTVPGSGTVSVKATGYRFGGSAGAMRGFAIRTLPG
ncbi:MAG TPA: hypothetical protein VI341_13655 [Actinomycetota bacterium]